ncbi:HlyD family efflux transporter periplasmic adaptor subunit [Kushneria aurantia]|uniref:HlyD family efflux transporter periplasmic adaptor subunit n=1 Tax=Kushneria aurantia TaxID=504092 RepID=A0ABV6G5C7_9GAMM|nr:HlyD family efflux transporter periplasmic adaptor subunit [Kushneria aurantia]
MSDSQSSAPSSDDSPDSGRRKRRLRIRLMLGLTVVLLLVAIGWGLWWYLVAQYSISTDDAYVHGNRLNIMPRISGTVTAIEAEDTDYVGQGEMLVRLDDSDYRLALDEALSNLAQTTRQVSQLYAGLQQQQAVIASREASLRQARDDYQRSRSLYQRNAVSQSSNEQARTTFQSAQANLQEARSELQSLQTQTAGVEPQNHPRVQAAAQQVRQAWLNLQRTTLKAPVAGQVAQRSVQLGQQVSPQSPLMAIVPLDQLWVEANFKETELAQVRIGQPVNLVSDFYGDDVIYHGKVLGLSAGTGSAFELLPPQNATGNWIKVVQRVPVRVSLDGDELNQHPLRVGLSMTATIDLHDTSGAALTEQPSSRSPRYSTTAYSDDPAPIEKRIDEVIANNLAGNATASAQGSADSNRNGQ